jgi:predicted DNA-binding transcriptional regulator YafY
MSDSIHKLNDFLRYAKKPMSKKEISAATGLNIESLDRMFRTLRRRYNAPLVWVPEANGYAFRTGDEEPVELAGMWFTKDELVSIFALRQLVKDFPAGPLAKTLDGLWGKIFEKVNWQESDFRMSQWDEKVRILHIGGREVIAEVFKNTVEALFRGRCLRITYKGLGKPASARIVTPLRLVRYRDNWYLDALCHQAGEYRSFALSRTLDSELTSDPAESCDPEKVQEHFASSYGIFNGKADKLAKIIFNGVAAEEVSKETWHPEQVGRLIGDSEYELCVPYGNPKELIMDILRWGEDAVVLEPEELRNAIREKLQRSLKPY